MPQDKSNDIMSSCGLLPKQTMLEKNNTYCCTSAKCCANTPGVGLKYQRSLFQIWSCDTCRQ